MTTPHTGRLDWTTRKTFAFADVALPVAEDLHAVFSPDAGMKADTGGVRPTDPRTAWKKRLAWPVVKRLSAVADHHAFYRRLAKWVRASLPADATFLEVACGDMTFEEHLPKGLTYNAIDYAVSEFQVRRVLPKIQTGRVNFALASALALPLADSTVSTLVCIEALQQIPDLPGVLRELRRVAKPGARFACTIGNGYAHKYDVKGVPWFVRNRLTNAQFNAVTAEHGFKVVEQHQLGRWVRLPWPSPVRDLNLPVHSRDEKYNGYFVTLFEVEK